MFPFIQSSRSGKTTRKSFLHHTQEDQRWSLQEQQQPWYATIMQATLKHTRKGNDSLNHQKESRFILPQFDRIYFSRVLRSTRSPGNPISTRIRSLKDSNSPKSTFTGRLTSGRGWCSRMRQWSVASDPLASHTTTSRLIIDSSILVKLRQHYKGEVRRWWCGDASLFFGVGDASWIKETITSDVYLDVVQDYVRQSGDFWGMDESTFIFQQDNARVHTTYKVMEFFEKESTTVLPWPANSPDLNPIEHVWAYMKRISSWPQLRGTQSWTFFNSFLSSRLSRNMTLLFSSVSWSVHWPFMPKKSEKGEESWMPAVFTLRANWAMGTYLRQSLIMRGHVLSWACILPTILFAQYDQESKQSDHLLQQ